MQNLLLDCKNIFITFSLLRPTLNMLIGTESIGIVSTTIGVYSPSTYFSNAECISSPNHSVWSSLNVST